MNSRSVLVPRQCSGVFLGFVVIGIFKRAAETLCWRSFAFNVDCRPVLCVNPDFLSISTSQIFTSGCVFPVRAHWQTRTHWLKFCSQAFQPVFPTKQVENMWASEYFYQISVTVIGGNRQLPFWEWYTDRNRQVSVTVSKFPISFTPLGVLWWPECFVLRNSVPWIWDRKFKVLFLNSTWIELSKIWVFQIKTLKIL